MTSRQISMVSSQFTHAYLMTISLISCPPIPSGPPRSTCSPWRGSQGTVRIRQMCEGCEANNKS
uniref:Uncharacterized protein n=1 Tax=Arundo donax TaxID=35708 RepID=A0A0A9CY36_ARUDO